MTTALQTSAIAANAAAQYRAVAALGNGAGKVSKQTDAGLTKVAEDFEAFFAGQVFEEMFSGLAPDSLTGGGEGESMFRSLMIQEYGRAVAKQHSLGIADIVKRQLLQIQEANQESHSNE